MNCLEEDENLEKKGGVWKRVEAPAYVLHLLQYDETHQSTVLQVSQSSQVPSSEEDPFEPLIVGGTDRGGNVAVHIRRLIIGRWIWKIQCLLRRRCRLAVFDLCTSQRPRRY